MLERTRMIPFSPPDISELEINEVAAALRSGWITTGPRTKKLEKELYNAAIKFMTSRKWGFPEDAVIDYLESSEK